MAEQRVPGVEPGAGAPAAHARAAYVGRFLDPGYGTLVVDVVEDELALRLGTSELPARHRGFETWDVRYEPLDLDLAVTFGTDATGAVADAVIDLDPTGPTRFRRTEMTA